MDYLGLRNCLDIESITFECVSDNINRSADVSWTMYNIYNHTKEETETLSQDTSIIEKKNGIQCTPFVFRQAIKPGGGVSEIKINMKMQDAFDFNKKEIVYLYPRNYGTKVKNIYIKYKTIGVNELNIQLHKVKKIKNTYEDEPLRSANTSREGEVISYSFILRENEINVQNLYYLFIRPKSEDK